MLTGSPSTIIRPETNHSPVQAGAMGCGCCILSFALVGTILAHFGITADQLMREFGLSAERIEGYVKQGFAWAWPNVLLGSLVIVPIWFVVFLFRPPGKRSSD